MIIAAGGAPGGEPGSPVRMQEPKAGRDLPRARQPDGSLQFEQSGRTALLAHAPGPALHRLSAGGGQPPSAGREVFRPDLCFTRGAIARLSYRGRLTSCSSFDVIP